MPTMGGKNILSSTFSGSKGPVPVGYNP